MMSRVSTAASVCERSCVDLGALCCFLSQRADGYLLAAAKRGNVASMKEVLDEHKGEVSERDLCE